MAVMTISEARAALPEAVSRVADAVVTMNLKDFARFDAFVTTISL